MPDIKLVRVKVVRRYTRGGVTHSPGATIEMPEYALKSAMEANPPYVELLNKPDAPSAGGSGTQGSAAPSLSR